MTLLYKTPLMIALTTAGLISGQLLSAPLSAAQESMTQDGTTQESISEESTSQERIAQETALQDNTVQEASSSDSTSEMSVIYKPTESSDIIELDRHEQAVEDTSRPGAAALIEPEASLLAQDSVAVPVGSGETIADIQVRFVDENGATVDGEYRDRIILREFDLEPGDTYDAGLAEEGLARVNELSGVSEADLSLESSQDGQTTMVVTVQEQVPGFALGRHFLLDIGSESVRPSALQGVSVAPVVDSGPPVTTGFSLPLRAQFFNIGGRDQTLTLTAEPGIETLGFDLTFRDPWIAGTNRLGYAVNAFALSHKPPSFQNGPNDLDVSTDSDPWENRFGGGVQFFRPIGENFDAAAGISYQRISFGDSVFGSRRFTTDEDGNALTASGNDGDDLLMLTLNTLYDGRNNPIFPTEGNRFQVGLDQAIPVGEADNGFTRLGGNYTQFIPVGLVRVPQTPGALVLNIQGGTMPFEAPPGYEAYTLGGASTVRGYATGEIGSPRNFLQGTVEYRFPFASIDAGSGFLQSIFGDDLVLAGSVFFDAATGFDSDDTVLGRPGDVRDKPGEGYGYGVGLLTTSNLGLLRLEFGITGGGDTTLHFGIGDRF